MPRKKRSTDPATPTPSKPSKPSKPPAPDYTRWVDALLDGKTDGATIVGWMRDHYLLVARHKDGELAKLNECTLRTKVSDIKRRALSIKLRSGQKQAHDEHEKGLATLRAAASGADARCRAAVDEFGSLDLHAQAKVVRRRQGHYPTANRASLCERLSENAGVAQAFAGLKVLAPSFDTFHLDREETSICIRRSNTTLLRKKTVTVPSAPKMLAHAQAVLGAPHEAPIYEVMAALLFASGRRTTEMLNGQSSFASLGKYEHGCYFGGQLKARRKVRQMRYKIPLLVPFAQFEKGLAFLRAWQGDVSMLTNKQVSSRYQPNLQRHLSENMFGGMHVRPHMLRSIYMRLVVLAFDWGSHRERRVAKYCLGHTATKDSDHYDHVELRSAPRLKRKFKKFPLTEAELEEVENFLSGETPCDESPLCAPAA